MSIYLDKLATSGLNEDDAKLLGIEYLEAQDTNSLETHFKEKPALKIPYFKPDGLPLSDIEGADQFYRVRYLGSPRTGFSALTKTKNNYDQPRGATPTAYWPRNNDWAKVFSKPTDYVVITEGELKAAKACKDGFSTIGLGGVHNWHPKGRFNDLVPSLSLLTWVRRPTYICFDSDYTSNKQVVSALRQLCDTLTMYGAYVHVLTLPEVYADESKTGLDDFLVSGGKESINHFTQMIEQAMPYCDAKKLFDLNDRYTIVTDLACVYDKVLDKKHPLDKFKRSVQRTNMIRVQNLPPKIDDSGDPVFNYIYKRAVDIWLDWPLQNCVDSLVYEPGQDRHIVELVKSTPINKLNLWDGWPVTPEKGSISLFLELIDYFFCSYDIAHKQWFLSWLAYPIQNPGAKLYTACVFHGTTQGTGKTLIAYTMKPIYGSNWDEIKQKDIQRDFNSNLAAKQFVLADEITGINQRKVSDLIKAMITSETNIINEKFINLYSIRNCVNYFYTSNHPDSFYLEDTDRRLFVITAPLTPLSKEFYREYDKWYRTEKAAKALLYYFLNEVGTVDFSPKGHAPHTDSKQEMFELTQSDLGEFVRQLRDYPEVILEGSARELFNSKEVLNLYDPFGKGKVTSNGVSRELTRAAVPTYERGKKVRVNGSVTRYYILRNIDKWTKASLQDVVDHIRNTGAFKAETNKF